MQGELNGKVAIVTGGSSGIGRTTAIKLAIEGAKVTIAARRRTESEAVVEEIQALGSEALYVPTDVTDESQVRNMVDRTVEHFGRLDCAFNNAGVVVGGGEDWIDARNEFFDEVIGPNLKGVWLCMKHELRVMLENQNGSIVNNASIGGYRANGGNEVYAASKHGVVGLSRRAVNKYGPSGIRINVLGTGIILTDEWRKRFKENPEFESAVTSRIPTRRLGTEEEIADVVVWLFSERSSYVNGASIMVDGGFNEA